MNFPPSAADTELTREILQELFSDATWLIGVTIPDDLKQNPDVQKDACVAMANLIKRGNFDGTGLIIVSMWITIDQIHNNAEIQQALPSSLELKARNWEFYTAWLAIPWVKDKSLGLMTRLKTFATVNGIEAARRHHSVMPETHGMHSLVTQPYEAFCALCIPGNI